MNTETPKITEKEELSRYFQDLQDHQNRILFFLTLTYKPYRDREYKDKDVNKFFTTFYVKYFLPRIMETKNFHTTTQKQLQPICFAFLDEHCMTSKVTGHRFNLDTNTSESIYEFPVRLHHHAILAVHPTHVNRIERYIGENTFANTGFSEKVMTSDLQMCDTGCIPYASRMLKKYPDFLSFPDKMHRVRHKYLEHWDKGNTKHEHTASL